MPTIVHHMLNIVLKTCGKVPADFLHVTCQESHFGVVNIAVSAALVIIRFIIPKFEIAYTPAHIAADTCTINIQIREDRPGSCGVLSARTFPETAVAIKGELIVIDIFIQSNCDFVIPKPSVRLIGILYCIPASQPCQI